MGEYLSPGVYVEEVSSGSKPIAGAGTSTGAFVGISEKGPVDEAKLITNWTQFTETFGGFLANSNLAYAVYHFFNEGGTKCFVVRTVKHDGDDLATSTTSTVSLVDGAGDAAIVVNATSPGTWGNGLSVSIAAGSDGVAGEVRFTVKDGANIVEDYDDIKEANLEDTVNESSKNVTIAVTGTAVAAADQSLAGGGDGDPDNLAAKDHTGAMASKRIGLTAFDTVDEINIVALPDADGDTTIMQQGWQYCEGRKDCFFVADLPEGLDPMGALAKRKEIGYSSFAATYYPWIKVSDPLTGKTKVVPPSGAVVGTYSNTDVVRGVHKAPAGINEGKVKSAIAVNTLLTKGENAVLNPKGVNAIRSFPDAGICIWGARTLTSDSEWTYINVRRLFLFVEESIDKGTQWVVFEPNDAALWAKVKRNLTAFLTRVWRDGALFGASADEAFFVKVDAENNPPAVRDAGQLVIEVGIAPVKPAEFVIIRISQKLQTA